MTARRRFSVGWVIVSFFLIHGGVFIAAVCVDAFSVRGSWVGNAILFLGSTLAGFLAGRMSRGTTIVEPAVAGALLVASVAALVTGTSGRFSGWLVTPSGQWGSWLAIGFVCGFGGFVGAVAGERNSAGRPMHSAVGWVVASTLVVIGVTLAAFVGMTAMQAEDAGEPPPGLIVSAMSAAALVTGAMIQIAAPRRILYAAGAGGLVVMVLVLCLNLDRSDSGAMFGCAFLGVVYQLSGSLGAWLAWSWISRARKSPPRSEPPTLPPARVS
jgi:hypothetical protein